MTRIPWLVVLAALAACHPAPRPARSPQARVEATVSRWARALRGDDAALDKIEDGGGQFAIAYGTIKKAASYVPDGTNAVETTMSGLVGLTMLQLLAPGIFGPPLETFYAVLPTGPLGPALVEAGLAAEMHDGTMLTVVPLPWDQTIGRLGEAQQRHRASLRRRAAWTCVPTTIEHTVLPTEPGLVDLARLSTHIVHDWLIGIEALWLVRGQCADGPALFVVTAYRNGDDRILLATGPRTDGVHTRLH